MTAVSTIAGMIPVAIGLGSGAETRAPMGTAIVGGMVTSTILTLIVIPVMYSVMDDLAGKIKRLILPAAATAGGTSSDAGHNGQKEQARHRPQAAARSEANDPVEPETTSAHCRSGDVETVRLPPPRARDSDDLADDLDSEVYRR